MNRSLRLPAAALAAALVAGCATTGDGASKSADPPSAANSQAAAEALRSAQQRDFLQRLQESLAQKHTEDPIELMNSLEHMLPSWQSEQRRGREEPIENILTIKVVSNFPEVLLAFERGTRDRQMVAAWALGFARVPPNDLGIESPHPKAVAALAGALTTHDDDVLRNVLLALWKQADSSTPLRPLLDVMVQHHDPDVRANAVLAVGTVVTPATISTATDGLLVALTDSEAKVRLHAADIARRYPTQAFTERLLSVLPAEQTPLVRASMASALGAARARSAAPLLLPMLDSGREVEAKNAHAALVAIFGVDRGMNAAAWNDLLH